MIRDSSPPGKVRPAPPSVANSLSARRNSPTPRTAHPYHRASGRALSAIRILIACGLLYPTLILGQVVPECFRCHDLGPEFPPQRLLAGSHGGDEGGTGNPRGCLTCHGESTAHVESPEQYSPDVSFGSRWSSSPAAQDSACLQCHEEGSAAHWRDALHMHNNLTCITCHDIHSAEDQVLVSDMQAGVCTTCHKAQKQGIHGLALTEESEPPCAACHNPHDHESAETQMLLNDSAGCRACHDLKAMAEDYRAGGKARAYHRVMEESGRSCLECHQGISHAATDTVTALEPTAVNSRVVTLFSPGATTAEWLTREHPGSQSLRQGKSCRLCHRGEEAALGEILVDHKGPAHRDVQISFRTDDERVALSLSWTGSERDRQLSFMWSPTGNDRDFDRGGCFAACHDNAGGISSDSHHSESMHLPSSRVQPAGGIHRAQIRDKTELESLYSEGKYTVLWQVELATGAAREGSLLEEIRWQDQPSIRAKTHYENGKWRVTILADHSHGGAGLLAFNREQRYTFGVALHDSNRQGRQHWVSLPMTMSLQGEDTDFRAAP